VVNERESIIRKCVLDSDGKFPEGMNGIYFMGERIERTTFKRMCKELGY